MQRVFRPLAVFSIATGACLALGLQLLVNGAQGSDGRTAPADLARMQLIEDTLYHVDESYVDPARLDWEQMFVAALDAIERRVPVVLFTREPGADRVAMDVGELRTVLEIAPVDSRPRLEAALGQVMALLSEHLAPGDVPMDGIPNGDPFAEVEYAAINGMLATLDPHSLLLSPDKAREMDAENEGEFGGLGITIEVDPKDGRLYIVEPMEGTPADRAGLRPSDHIVRIDGESTVNLGIDEAVTRLRGPVGATVELEVAREGVANTFPVKVARELIPYNPVTGQLLDGGIGYVRIEGFHDRVESDLHRILTDLTRLTGGRLSGLVLDLRGNPGGFLNQAVKVADTFLESGEIVSTIDRNGRRADLEEAGRSAEPLYPIAVLVDANSASASEIVAGALRYNERAVVIGERSFGKGSVQNLHDFDDGSKLKLTISKYLTSGDRSLQAVGIPADIELERTVIPTDAADADVQLYVRELQKREADFERSLERVTLDIDPPAYRIRYVERPAQEVRRRAPSKPDLRSDVPVLIARDVIDAAAGWRRSDVLSAAAPVVARHQKLGNDALVSALGVRGIDWRSGPAVERGALPLRLTVDVGEDGVLSAGDKDMVTVTVENTGTKPLYRVAALATDGALLDGREFLFGLLQPGEKRSYAQEIEVPKGWPAEQVIVKFAVRDSGKEPLGTVPLPMSYASRPLPAFSWSWSVSDKVHGDGDGIVDAGEHLDIDLTLTNVGEGASTDAFARLRNRAGTRVDLLTGTLLPGTAEAGCAGDKCARTLAPGETWHGAFDLALQGTDASPLELSLDLGDAAAYDRAAVWRSAFLDYFGQKEKITLSPGAPLPASDVHRPPTIQISRAPELRAAGARATLSGVVEDDRGLSHVMVYVGDDKVLFEGGGGAASRVRSVPFTADVTLEPGSNVITVLATDDQGFRATRSVVTWLDDQEIAKAGAP